jgi:hypothetical protein
MAQAFELHGAEATQRWNTMAELLTRSGKDPNWCRRPSSLDQLRGWKRQPLARKNPHRGDVSHGLVNVAASVDTYGRLRVRNFPWQSLEEETVRGDGCPGSPLQDWRFGRCLAQEVLRQDEATIH